MRSPLTSEIHIVGRLLLPVKPLPRLFFAFSAALAAAGGLAGADESGVVRLSALYVDEDALPPKYPIFNQWEVPKLPVAKRKPIAVVPKGFSNSNIWVNVTLFYVVDSTGHVTLTRPYSVQLLKGDTHTPIDRPFVEKLIASGALSADSRNKPLDQVRLDIGLLYVREMTEAVKRWTFVPGFKDGKSVAVRMLLTGQQMWANP